MSRLERIKAAVIERVTGYVPYEEANAEFATLHYEGLPHRHKLEQREWIEERDGRDFEIVTSSDASYQYRYGCEDPKCNLDAIISRISLI